MNCAHCQQPLGASSEVLDGREWCLPCVYGLAPALRPPELRSMPYVWDQVRPRTDAAPERRRMPGPSRWSDI